MTLIVPKFIGIEDYGYWQLFILYTSFVGFLHFGWIDGIYLRYGGREYRSLDKKLFYSQFLMLAASQIFFALIIVFLSIIFIENANKAFIIRMTAVDLVIVNTRYLLLFTLQATARFKKYSSIIILDRLQYVFLVIILLAFGFRDYQLMIFADLTAKIISLMFALNICKDIVFLRIADFNFSFSEVASNIGAGINLLISNIASRLVIGSIRFGIENNWDIETFGKVSLTLSVSRLVLLIINAIGIVMYPVLRRTNAEKLPNIYLMLRDILMPLLLGALFFYYPIRIIVIAWLPSYADSFFYLGILFPIIVYEGKMSLLINTYLLTLRQEKAILKVNVLTAAVSFILTIIFTSFLRNLDLSIISIIFLITLRCILAEIILSNNLQVLITKDIFLELIMTTVFILSAWFLDSSISIIVYSAAYFIYLIFKHDEIRHSFNHLVAIMRR